ncbi:MAG: nitroreductase family protein [Flavobacteriaceae bacterium]|nr:nitroreductase family protein [Flavobacteriaceae bacterium]
MSEVKDHILVNGYKHVLYAHKKINAEESIQNSKDFQQWMDTRRSIREFSNQSVPKEVIHNILMSASTAPSGAHKQPWTFCVISNTELKHKIREAAEAEERETYANRMSDRWRKDLEPLGTNDVKPFIDIAPYIIVVFKRVYEHDQDDTKHNNYYVNESIGIASGILITAIHNAGLVTLTHTPSPMNFLTKILDRPSNERAYLLLPVGYPENPVYVPDLKRKPLEDIAVFYE